jgi:hypothetical protein
MYKLLSSTANTKSDVKPVLECTIGVVAPVGAAAVYVLVTGPVTAVEGGIIVVPNGLLINVSVMSLISVLYSPSVIFGLLTPNFIFN